MRAYWRPSGTCHQSLLTGASINTRHTRDGSLADITHTSEWVNVLVFTNMNYGGEVLAPDVGPTPFPTDLQFVCLHVNVVPSYVGHRARSNFVIYKRLQCFQWRSSFAYFNTVPAVTAAGIHIDGSISRHTLSGLPQYSKYVKQVVRPAL